jgi:hypothetical protein
MVLGSPQCTECCDLCQGWGFECHAVENTASNPNDGTTNACLPLPWLYGPGNFLL